MKLPRKRKRYRPRWANYANVPTPPAARWPTPASSQPISLSSRTTRSTTTLRGWYSVPHHKHIPIILGINLAVAPDSNRRISRAHRQTQEDIPFQGSALIDHVHVPIFAIGVYRSLGIN